MCVINYTKDGRPFLHKESFAALRNSEGVTTHYIAQTEKIFNQEDRNYGAGWAWHRSGRCAHGLGQLGAPASAP